MQSHFVLFLGEFAAGHGCVPIGVRDRFPRDPNFFVGHRHRLSDCFGNDVLPQTRLAGLDLLGADVQTFLRTRHRIIGIGT